MNGQLHQDGDPRFNGESEIRSLFEASSPVTPSVNMDSLPPLAKPTASPRKITRRAALVATGLAASFATAMVLFRPRLTFAQVQEAVSATKSVRYEGKALGELANQDVAHAERVIEEAEHMLANFEKHYGSKPLEEQKATRLQLAESLRQAQEYLEQRDANPPYDRILILGRYLQRQERKGFHGESIDITDMTTGKSISLDPKNRTATIFTSQTTISASTGSKSTAAIVDKPNLEVDFYSSIRNVPVEAKELAERKVLSGTECVGFRLSDVDGPYKRTRTFWVDKGTKLPKQIDIQLRSDNEFHAPADYAKTNIEFNVKLDKTDFSTEVPVGYTLKKSGFVDWVE